MSDYKERFHSACAKVKEERDIRLKKAQIMFDQFEERRALEKKQVVNMDEAADMLHKHEQYLIVETMKELITKAYRIEMPPYVINKQLSGFMSNEEERKLEKLLHDSLVKEIGIKNDMTLDIKVTGIYYTNVGKILKECFRIINITIVLNF